jgi:hypothetical protein
MITTVDVRDVEYGDYIFPLHVPVGSILSDGITWFFGNERGIEMVRRSIGSRVQVWRGERSTLSSRFGGRSCRGRCHQPVSQPPPAHTWTATRRPHTASTVRMAAVDCTR